MMTKSWQGPVEKKAPVDRKLLKKIDELVKQANFGEIQNIVLSNESMVPKVISLLDHQDVAVREQISRILGTLQDPKAIPALIKLIMKQAKIEPEITHDQRTGLNVEIREPFYNWIFTQKQGSNLPDGNAARTAIRAIMNTTKVEKLISALTDANPEVRSRTVEVLMNRRIEDENSNRLIKSLIHVSTFDPDLYTRRHARLALRNQGNQIIEPLTQVLQDKDPKQRWSAAWTLYWHWDTFRDTSALMPLIEAFDKEDVAVAAGAYQLFIRRGKPGTEKLLTEALHFAGVRGGEMAYHYLNSGNEQREGCEKMG